MITKLKNKFLPVKKGLCSAYKSELSLRIQIIFFVLLILIIGFINLFNVKSFSDIEYAVLLIVSCLVIVGELFNTAIEKLIDYLHPEKHPEIAKVKDISASAVFIFVLLALLVGSIIIIPRLIGIIKLSF